MGGRVTMSHSNQPGLWGFDIVSGSGQYHSNASTVSKRKPYNKTNLIEIKDMVVNPQLVPKENSSWVLFTTYTGEHARSGTYLRDHAQFIAAWADIDEGDHSLDEICDLMDELDANYIVYSSRSAAKENKKWRVIVPYSELVKAEHHILLAECLNDHIERFGIKPDRVTEHVNQLCYLPNQGDFYEYFIEDNRGDLS
jgi:hypothetical protein